MMNELLFLKCPVLECSVQSIWEGRLGGIELGWERLKGGPQNKLATRITVLSEEAAIPRGVSVKRQLFQEVSIG